MFHALRKQRPGVLRRVEYGIRHPFENRPSRPTLAPRSPVLVFPSDLNPGGVPRGQHLLLAAAEAAGELPSPLAQHRESLVGQVEIARDLLAGERPERAQQQVLFDRQLREEAPAFRHQRTVLRARIYPQEPLSDLVTVASVVAARSASRGHHWLGDRE
jgi:hypothetical protein